MRNPLQRTFNAEEARKALSRRDQLEYMLSTSGYADLQAAQEKERQWAFKQSRSTEFKKRVLEHPEDYCSHTGYLDGLDFIDEYIKKVRLAGEKAKKDLERHEQN